MVLKTSSGSLQDMYSRRLQDISCRSFQNVFSVTILHLPSRLQNVFEDKKLLYWRRLQDILKTCLEDVLKTCLKDVLKTLWRQTKSLLGISASNKSKCVSNKSIFRKSISHNSKASLYFNSQISIFILF